VTRSRRTLHESVFWMRFIAVVQTGWCFEERRVYSCAAVNRVRGLRVNEFWGAGIKFAFDDWEH